MISENDVVKTRGEATSDGAGVKLIRFVGISDIPHADPFLLLDEFKSDDPEAYIRGFPSHPHRGFETVTYILKGRMRHRDSRGHEGLLEEGAVQWMSAAKGIVHSEMPEMENGLLWGYQLWINLPATLKMEEPVYEDIPAGRIPVKEWNDGRMKIISGEALGMTGPVNARTPFQYLHVYLNGDSPFPENVIAGSSVLITLIDGSLHFSGSKESEILEGTTLHFQHSDVSKNTTNDHKFMSGSSGAEFLLISGEPIGEPIARGGPFVMNTREEIIQAFRDFESGNMR